MTADLIRPRGAPGPPPGRKWNGGPLWWHRNFTRYLTGQTANVAGSAVSQVVIPVLAVVELDASTAQVALLAILGQLPPALLALHAGALADRYSKRRQMIAGDLVSAVAMVTLPLVSTFGTLTLTHLMAVCGAGSSRHAA
ncbi:MFS transporter [Streptomyces sp. NPDC057565]|uniref:MFS transporter n=1 Tax=Streptomyces sp. NPDC057565 TaxID=3346169 RepID=UPI003688B546